MRILNIFLISGIKVFLAIKLVNSRPQDPPVTIAPDLDPLNDTWSDHVDKFKSKILEHLKLNAAPTNDSTQPQISEDVIRVLKEKEDTENVEGKENIVVYSTNDNFTCLNNYESNCRRFEFSIPADFKSTLSVHSWFYKRNSYEAISINVYSTSDVEDDPVIKLKEHHSKLKSQSGWISFELPKILALEQKDDELYCTIEVKGSEVGEEGQHKPFLVVSKNISNEKRVRRSIESEENCTGCCPKTLRVSVTELEWESWVISPTVFDIQTCEGHCADTQSNYKTRYQVIRHTLHKLNSTAFPKPDCSFWVPSCKPSAYLPQRLIFWYNGTIHDQVIPKVNIESCEC